MDEEAIENQEELEFIYDDAVRKVWQDSSTIQTIKRIAQRESS